MRIGTKLTGGFITIALLTAVVGILSAWVSKQVESLRHVEMPMCEHLGQLQEDIWEAVHHIEVYVRQADGQRLADFAEEAEEVEAGLAAYRALTVAPAEQQACDDFRRAWANLQQTAHEVAASVDRCKQAEDAFFVHVDVADDVIDFDIQAKWSADDMHLLAKEQAVREVEVSIWEAIHAAEQYAGLTPTISRASHAQHTFADLMEKQFEDVEEFWAVYKPLITDEQEAAAAAKFEAEWAKAIAAGRQTIQYHDESVAKFAALSELAAAANALVDGRLRTLVDARIASRDRNAHRAQLVGLAVGALAFVAAIAIGMVLTRSITTPMAKLQQATAELAAGRRDHRIALAQRDEFGQVADAFDHMAERLQNAAELTEAEVVHRRAAETSLQLSNADLKATMAKLSEVNAELREFAYIASHDLREPLRKISSFGSLLEQSIGDNLSEDDRENLHFMIDGAQRMNQMVHGLLQYSRVHSSEKLSDPVDLNETIDNIRKVELGALIEETGATVDVPEALPTVGGHPDQIAQLMQNLIGNAITYRRENVTPCVTITAEAAPGGWVKILVRDNGIGIAEDHYENVFKMFRRLHSRRKYSGTGIGLAVCKRIVDKHGGRIGVHATLDEGSTFWFTLPVASLDACAPAAAQEASS